MRGTVSTACKTFQTTLRKVWSSGSTYAEMTEFLGVTKDQIFRLRDRLKLPLRLDRSTRKKPPRHKDPTPEEIASACAALRAKHLADRRNEPASRTYRTTEIDLISFRFQRSHDIQADSIEQLIDDLRD